MDGADASVCTCLGLLCRGDLFGASERDLIPVLGLNFQYNKTGFIPGSNSLPKSPLWTYSKLCICTLNATAPEVDAVSVFFGDLDNFWDSVLVCMFFWDNVLICMFSVSQDVVLFPVTNSMDFFMNDYEPFL